MRDNDELRRQAEAKIPARINIPGTITPEEAQRIIHELQVHQIELELQNENLRKTHWQLEESRTRYADLYDFAPVGYLTLDRYGMIQEANLTAATQFGVDRGRLINSPMHVYIDSGDLERWRDHCNKVLAAPGRQTFVVRLRGHDKIQFDALLESIAVTDASDSKVFRTTITDITKLKQAEEALKKYRDHLERLVEERTAAMVQANEQLKGEIAERYQAEAGLKESERRYKNLVESVTSYIYSVTVKDEKPIQTSHGSGCAAVTGYSSEEYYADPNLWYRMIYDKDRDIVIAQAEKVLLGGELEPLEHRIVHKNGNLIWIRNTFVPQYNPEGQLVSYDGLVENITERKMAEEALGESEERFRSLTAMAPVGIYLTDTHGRCQYVNQRWCEMSGLTTEEALGEGWVKGIHPEDQPLVSTAWDQMVQSEGKWELEYRFQTFDEKVTWVSGLATPLRNSHGQLVGYIGTNSDISERQRSKQALQETEHRLRRLYETVQAGVILQSADGTIIHINQVACDILGMKPDEIAKKTSFDPVWQMVLEDGTPVPVAEHPSMLTIRTGQPIRNAVRGILANNLDQTRWLLLNTEPIINPETGAVSEVTITFQDITGRKQAEEEIRISLRFLEIVNKHIEIQALLEAMVSEIKIYTDCEAVGIRVLDAQGMIPYLAYQGFSHQFYEMESPLSIKSDQCMCINVIKGDFNPELPFYSPGGSFYMNGTTRFLSTVSKEDKGQTRNVCNAIGYESVALIPLRWGDKILGLIHLADKREDMVPLHLIETLEKTGMQLATAFLRVQAEEQLRDSEEKYRTIVETAQEGIWVIDNEARTTYANQRMAAMLGYQVEEMLGRSLYDFMDEATSSEANELFEKHRHGLPEQHDFRFHCRDGSVIWTSVNTNAILDHSGKFLGSLGMIADITDRKHAQEKIQASLHEKEVLLREIHHRVKNNMQVISSFLYLQSDKIKNPELDLIFKDCQNRIRSMALIHGTLYRSEDLSRVNIKQYLQDLTKIILHSHNLSNMTINITIEGPDITLNINQAVPCGLIFNELISNSFKHAFPQGRPGEFRIEMQSDDDHFMFLVQDNGVGLPKDFNWRAANTMGLEIVRLLVTQLQGQIEISSNGGTTIKIDFQTGR